MSIDVLSGPLQTERLGDGRRKLLREFVISVDDHVFTIPSQGYTTDYSSIPWYGRFVVRWSKVDIAGVVHDYLYVNGGVTRSTADEVWRLVALAGEHHANRLQARICWLALRVGGCCAWRVYRELDPIQE